VLIDDRDLTNLDLVAYRRQVGMVLQENLLISGTIAENVALGDQDPDPTKVMEALRLVGAEEFIRVLPQSCETPVGELGLTLSGGQRQRIALARALYRNPRILIFDEATSALDSISTRLLWQNLPLIFEGRATILISHHLATVRLAHRILVLHDGIIAEEGTHEALLARGGLYCNLVSGHLEF
jgi:ATP-binding cassette subfamily B protein